MRTRNFGSASGRAGRAGILMAGLFPIPGAGDLALLVCGGYGIQRAGFLPMFVELVASCR